MNYLKRFGLLLAMAGIFMSFSVGSLFAQEKEDRGTDQKMERGHQDREKGEARTVRSRRSVRRHSRYTAGNWSKYDRKHKTVRHENENDKGKN